MRDIHEGMLQSIIDKAYAEHGYAWKTLKNLRDCISAFIKYCRRRKATDLRLEGLTIPAGARKPDKSVLQPADLWTLMENDTTVLRGKRVEDIYINAYRFEAVLGLRPGEILGLMSSDIVGDVVHLRRAINQYNEVTTGKNKNAQRILKLTDLAFDILHRQKVLLIEMGIRSPYIFPNETGEHIVNKTYYSRWKRYCAVNSIAASISPYELRHTFISACKLIPKGLLDPVVGHSPDMDTFGVYGHEMRGDLDEAADLINAALTAALQKGKTEAQNQKCGAKCGAEK